MIYEPKLLKRLYAIGMILNVIGVVFWIIETDYFGWNALPESRFELCCDIVSGSSIALGSYLWSIAIIYNAINKINH